MRVFFNQHSENFKSISRQVACFVRSNFVSRNSRLTRFLTALLCFACPLASLLCIDLRIFPSFAYFICFSWLTRLCSIKFYERIPIKTDWIKKGLYWRIFEPAFREFDTKRRTHIRLVDHPDIFYNNCQKINPTFK